MEIKTLTIYYADKNNQKLFEQCIKYEFKEKNLITSHGVNSRGKTTLIRFLLFALGYDIPLTDGVNSQNYKTEIEFLLNNKMYRVNRENRSKKLYIDGILKKEVPNNEHLLEIFSCSTAEDIDNILGCFYIDQEKGWTLLNRGRVIGDRRFNIEKFISFIKNLDETSLKIRENEKLIFENKKIKILEDIKKIKIEAEENEEEKYIYSEVKELKINIERLHLKLRSLEYQKKSLEKMIENNQNIIKKILSYDLKINIDGRNYPLTEENIVDFKVDNEFIKLDIQEVIKKIKDVTNEKKYLKERLEYAKEKIDIEGIDDIISSIDVSDKSYENLLRKKDINNDKKRRNKAEITEKLNNNVDEIWNNLREILLELDISKEYIKKDIIFSSKLSGISGGQLHKLTFSMKLSFMIYLKENLNLNLPFIIDSPMSGEINKDTANKMLLLASKKLPNAQIIVSSVYQDYDIIFNNIIYLNENGVIGNLSEFINKTKTKEIS